MVCHRTHRVERSGYVVIARVCAVKSVWLIRLAARSESVQVLRVGLHTEWTACANPLDGRFRVTRLSSPGDDLGPALPVALDQPPVLEGIEPTLHRPPAPTPLEDDGIRDDVGQMLGRRIGDRVELVECVRAAHPSHGDGRRRGLLGKVRVFAAVAGVLGAEPAEVFPHRGGQGEGQGPEQFVLGSDQDLIVVGNGSCGMRVGEEVQPGQIVATGPGAGR